MKKLLLLGALALAGMTSKAETALVDGYVDRSDWTITACSWISEGGKSGPVTAIYDDDLSTYYHQNWSSDTGRGTHWLVIDLGKEQPISGVDIWGRQNHENGHILAGKVYVSTTPFEAFTADADAATHDVAKAYYDNAENVAAGTISYELNNATRNDVQSVRFDETVARYVLILTDQTSNNHLCVSEIQVQGKVLPRVDLDRTGWTATACSEATDLEGAAGGYIANIFDDNLSTYYHQNWSSDKPADAYHWFVIDMGSSKKVDGFKYWRRQGNSNGQIYAGKVYVSDTAFSAFESHSGDTNDAKTYYEDAANVAAGEFAFTYDKNADLVRICDFEQSATGRYVLVIVSDAGMSNGGRHLCCAEFKLFQYTALAPVWEAALDATLITRARNLEALGGFIGKGTMPSTAMPDDLTEENLQEKAEAANASLQAYINSFENQLIYIRHASRRSNAYLTAVARGNRVGLNTTTEPTADAVWQIRFLNNDEGFYLYSRTANMWITTAGGSPAMLTESAVGLTSSLNTAGNLLFVQAGGSNGFNIDTAANDLVWYGTNDDGSQWTAEATTVDNQIFAEPEVSTADAPKYYRIVNARWMDKHASSNMAVNGENQDGNGNGETNSRANAVIPGIYWRLEAAGDGVKLVNLTGYELTYSGTSATTMTDNGATVYLIKQTDELFHGVNAYAISNTAEQGGSSCLDASEGNGETKFCWSPTAEGRGNGNNGSAWYFLLASDTEVANATATYVAAVKNRLLPANASLADLFGQELYDATLAHSYAGEETVAAVNAAKASGNYAKTDENVTAVNEIVNAKVAELAGRHFLIRNCNTNYSNCYMTVADGATAPTADASDVNAVWSFVANGEGYLLTSAATGHSLSQTDGMSTAIPVVEEGLPYSISYNANIPGFNFTLVPTADITDVSYYAIHQGTNSLVCKWTAQNIAGSHWTLECLDEAPVEVNKILDIHATGLEIVLPEGVAVNTHESAADMVITITRHAAEPQAVRHSVAPDDGVHTIAASDFVDGRVELSGLEKGKYTLSAPAGMFLIDGKPSAALTHVFTVNADGSTTGVEEITAESAVKVIYDLQGRRLSAPVKGVNIINGKKVFVK